MASPTVQSPSADEQPPKNEGLSSHQSKLRDLAPSEDNKDGTSRSPRVETGKQQLSALQSSMQRPVDGKCWDHVSIDGVYRVLRYLPTPPDQPTDFEIIDAKPMSPEMIKAFLDTQPWSQAREDRFRGTDGRTVPRE